MTESAVSSPLLHRVRTRALAIGVIGVIACAVGWAIDPASFYRAYLHSWLLWAGVSFGSLGLIMVHQITGGRWGDPLLPLAHVAADMIPLIILLFVPIAVAAGVGSLYPWARLDQALADPMLLHRRVYLNTPFFLGRSALYFLIFMALAFFLKRWSSHNSQPRRAYRLSAVGLVVYVLLMGLFASTDWIMSLEDRYYSTVFGLIVVAGQGVSAMCVLIIMAILLRDPLSETPLDRNRLNDLGSLLLTLVLLWEYLLTAQLVINYIGNTQDKNVWYVQRLSNGWWWIGWTIVVLHLFVPFLALLIRDFKQSAPAMLALCIVLLAMRAVYAFWLVAPSGADPLPLLRDRWTWMDFLLPVGLGGLWIAGSATFLIAKPPPLIGGTAPAREP